MVEIEVLDMMVGICSHYKVVAVDYKVVVVDYKVVVIGKEVVDLFYFEEIAEIED